MREVRIGDRFKAKFPPAIAKIVEVISDKELIIVKPAGRHKVGETMSCVGWNLLDSTEYKYLGNFNKSKNFQHYTVYYMSKSAEYYRSHPEARKKKAKTDKEINARPEQRAKRSLLVKANREAQKKGTAKIGDKKDFSHTKNGLVQKPQSVNRGSKTDSKGDRTARSKKK